MELTIEDVRQKDLLKRALLELFQERRDAVVELLEEVIEDLAMGRAIEEGKDSGLASADEVHSTLRRIANS